MGKSVTTERNFRWLHVTGAPGVVAEYWPNSKDGRCNSEGIARSFDHHGGNGQGYGYEPAGLGAEAHKGHGASLAVNGKGLVTRKGVPGSSTVAWPAKSSGLGKWTRQGNEVPACGPNGHMTIEQIAADGGIRETQGLKETVHLAVPLSTWCIGALWSRE